MCRVELVVARFQERVEWTRNIPPTVRCTLYNKGLPLQAGWSAAPLANVGREAHTYLHHIVERFNDLAEVTVFSQGHPFDHASDFHRRLRAVAEAPERAPPFAWWGFIIDTDDPRGRRLFVNWSKNEDGRELQFDAFHRAVFGEPAPSLIHFYVGGQFAVRRDLVQGRGLDFYRRALDVAATFPDAAHCFERSWDRVFGVRGVDPAELGPELSLFLKRTKRRDG